MKIEYYWKHMDKSPAAEEYANKKFSKLDKFLHDFISAHMSTEVVGNDRKHVKLAIHGDGEDFIADVEDNDIYAAIDIIERKMGTQLRRHHDKLAKH